MKRGLGSFAADALQHPAPGPFNFTSQVEFLYADTYRFCAYLEDANAPDNTPPVVFAESVVTVTEDVPTPVAPAVRCNVPNLRNLSLAKAKSALKRRHCALGRVTRTTAARGKRLGSLVVSKQAFRAESLLLRGRRINVTVKPKRTG